MVSLSSVGLQQNGALVLGLTETGVQTNQKLGPEVKSLLKQSTRLDSSKEFDGVLVRRA